MKKTGARVYLYEKDVLIKKVTYVYENGTESEPLSRFISLGMVTDSILIGEECQNRFFVYPFINGSDRTVSISCFGQQLSLAPGETGTLIDNSGKKFKHSTDE